MEAVAPVNLPLAGRCAAQHEVRDRLSPRSLDDLGTALFARSRDRQADLRARIDAGLALGELGGPPFERHRGRHGDYLLPPVVAIAGGDYLIGCDEPYHYRGVAYGEEAPSCTVSLDAFSIGRFPVTNAEWAYFMDGGGYEDERWWEGEKANSWLRGHDTAINIRNAARYWRDRFRRDPGLIDEEFAANRMDEDTRERWLERLAMSDDAFEKHLGDAYPGGPQRQPRHWHNPRFNNPMQPIIGISCFEAGAFAAWLAAQSGLPIRLPSEAEWEAAARGKAARRFAYGDIFDPLRGNTAETHIRFPTPIGVFPDGDTPEGAADMTGNTYDLTGSLWGEDPIRTDHPYPYDAGDGREQIDAPVTVSRVGRGGAWYLGETHARATYRGRDRYDLRPDDWLNFRGCRICLSAEKP